MKSFQLQKIKEYIHNGYKIENNYNYFHLPLCSPRKTSLNFLKGLLKSAEADMTEYIPRLYSRTKQWPPFES